MARLVKRMRPVHPGEVLREDYLIPLDLKTLPTMSAIQRQVPVREQVAAWQMNT